MSNHKDIGFFRELGRKAIHLGALGMPLGLWFVPRGIARPILLICFLIAAAIDFSRWGQGAVASALRRIFGRVLRPHETNRFSGGTYILASGVLCASLFNRPVAVAALICIILGDTAAVFVGRYLGRLHFGHKTLEGSLGFFAAALLGILWIPGIPMHVKVAGAVVGAVVEALPLPLDDNLTVPVAVGATMTVLM